MIIVFKTKNVLYLCLWFNFKELKKDLINPLVQFSSVAQSCPTLCNPMDCSMLGFPVHHELPELTQTHVHWVGDAIQLFHPLSSPSSPALNLSQNRGLFQWVSSSHQVGHSIGASDSALVLPVNIQGWFPLGLTGLISLQYKCRSHKHQMMTVTKSPLMFKELKLTVIQKNLAN